MENIVQLSARHFCAYSRPNSGAIVNDLEWVSNKHWMILRANVENQSLITPELYPSNFKRPSVRIINGPRSAVDFWSIVTFDAEGEFSITRLLYQFEDTNLYRVLVDRAHGLITLLEAEYVEALGFCFDDTLPYMYKPSRQCFVIRDANMTRAVSSLRDSQVDFRGITELLCR